MADPDNGRGEALFYHLERSSLDSVLPKLLEKTLSRQARAFVLCASPERAQSLNAHLWTYDEASFLPHDLAGTKWAARQPILIGTEQRVENDAAFLFVVDGATPQRWDGFSRVCIIFDGSSQASVEQARALWRSAEAEGLSCTYWRQDQAGAWRQAA